MEAHMQKHIRFAIAAAIFALTMFMWASASLEMPNNDVAPQKVEPPASNPHPLPFQVLRPIY